MNIAIIEKNDLYRESLKIALNQINDFTVLCDSNNYSDVVSVCARNKIDVVLLDKSIGQAKNYEALKLIHEESPQCKILVMLDSTETYFTDDVLKEGADDVIIKSSDKKIFEKSIRRITQN